MKKIFGVCLLALVPPIAQASIELGNIGCSGGLSISDQNGVSLGCTGDFSLSGGSMTVAGGNISINADGSLSLSDLFLSAVKIDLSANSIYIGDNVRFYSNDQPILETGGSGSGIGTPTVTVRNQGRVELTAALSIEINQGGDISLPPGNGNLSFIPRELISAGNIVLQPGGKIVVQGLPLTVPLPGALLTWSSGLALCFGASWRRRIGEGYRRGGQ